MLTEEQALDRLDHVLVLAKNAGADAADTLYFGEASTGIGVRLGKLEEIGRSEGEEIGLRLFLGERSAQVSVSDLSPSALDEAVARAMAMAREATPDRYAGLAPEELLAKGPFTDLARFDPEVERLPAERLRQMALAVEDAGRAVAGITGSEGGSASAGSSVSALATSTGFRGAESGTSVSASAVVIAGDGEGRQRDYAWHSSRHLADLEALAEIGRRAGERTVARLAPKPAPTGRLPVLFDPRVSASLLGHLLSAIAGPSIARKTSFLREHAGKQIFRPEIIIRDDPSLPKGLRSRSFDGEGLPTTPRDLISGGTLSGWLMDSASARQLGLQPTGHASRGAAGPPGVSASNLWLEGGRQSPESLIAEVEDGLYVNELIGMGVNTLTGDYSRGASGFRIRKGVLAEAVGEATIAGNLLDMFAKLEAGNDLVRRYGIDAPTLRIDGMTVAGQ